MATISAIGETVQPHGGLKAFLGSDGAAWFQSAATPSAQAVRRELATMKDTLARRMETIDRLLACTVWKRVGVDEPGEPVTVADPGAPAEKGKP